MDESEPSLATPEYIALCIHQAISGDVDALERLLAIHHRRFLGFARRKIGVDWSNKIDPDDLLQDAYVQVFAKVASFTPTGTDAFYYWVTRIIENKFFDSMRHWSRLKRSAAREVAQSAAINSRYDALLTTCSPLASSPSLGVRKAELQGALLGCIARLPSDYREVIRRVHLGQESYEAVAADLDRSPEAVRRMAGRAVAQLRECLGRASQFLSTLG